MGKPDKAASNDAENVAAALQLLESLEVEISFDEDDPVSVDSAIAAVEEAIDSRLSTYRGDARVESAILRVKTDFRTMLIERATSMFDDDEDSLPQRPTLH
jgi:hypothetical protein